MRLLVVRNCVQFINVCTFASLPLTTLLSFAIEMETGHRESLTLFNFTFMIIVESLS